MTNLRPPWLIARPIAHRGLHDRTRGLIENSIGSAKAAIARNYAIECDVQLSRDGVPMVFHDFTLDRLTGQTGALCARDAKALQTCALSGSGDFIPSLQQFLEIVAGRTPLIVEIKSAFDGDMRLAECTARCVSACAGPVALKSFDPDVMAHLRANRAALGIERMPLGMVAEAHYDHEEWNLLSPDRRRAFENFLHWEDTQPDFLSWNVNDLPHATPHLLRKAAGLPVMTWTVRTPEQRERAKRWTDQIVFEGWLA